MLLSLCLFETSYLIGLWTLGALNDVELYFVTFLEALVSLALNRAVMNENVGSTIATQEAVAFSVVKPLYCALVLCHWSDFLSLLL